MVEGVLSVRLKWVDIKELVSLQINRSHIVEQGNFRDIQVLGILSARNILKLKRTLPTAAQVSLNASALGKRNCGPNPSIP